MSLSPLLDAAQSAAQNALSYAARIGDALNLTPQKAPTGPTAPPAENNPLRDATQTLRDHFDQIIDGRQGLDRWFSDSNTINRRDLERLAADPDPKNKALRDAAQEVLNSDVAQHFLDLGAGRGALDGKISRDDLDGALKTIDSGHYADELLDTAAGRGGFWPFSSPRDGNVSMDDIDAALKDPPVPNDVKDALRLIKLGPDGANGAIDTLRSLSPEGAKAASDLYNSPEFAGLSKQDQQLVTETFHDARGDTKVTQDLQAMIHDPSFQAMSADQKTAKLADYNLTHSTEFNALSSSDKQLVQQAIADPAHDAKLSQDLKSLISSSNFQGLDATVKTSVLSQVKNYPNSEVAHNFERMLGKDWFKDFDTGDKQRALKLIGYMSYPRGGEDTNIINNTLEKFLGDNATYKLKIEPISAPPGNITFGNAADGTMRVNQDLIAADNGKLENESSGYGTQLATDTIPHEINHLVNGDKVAQTFDYLNEEYRAWSVGFQASHGRPPTNEEALERWSYFVSPGGGYYDSAAKGALNNPAEAAKIFDELSRLSGVKMDASNYQKVLSDLANGTTKYGTDPNAPAAVTPPGNRDNS